VFDFETLKNRLTLYGHKLPVQCLDSSSDSKLIASGSLDKDLKVWGTNFGDCHFSKFAHKDGVVSLKFKPDSNYCFTGGKDGLIKVWNSQNGSYILAIS
ncbi:MAG: Dip2/Utp12 protein, partial [Paramarteilia canceri]